MIIDLHSDTVYKIWGNGGNLLRNEYSIDREKLIRGNVLAQCFALFVPQHEHVPENKQGLSPWKMLNELHDVFVEKTEEASIPVFQIGRNDIPQAILTTEEGASIEGDISRLEILKEWGVRIFGLTWNFENELGYPNSDDKEIMGKGLKEKGIEAVRECGRLGIIVDVSHLSDGGFFDVMKYAEGPIIATHSNSRAVTAVSRNLTDEELRMLSDKGGVMGLNLCPAFLHDEKAEKAEDAVSRVADMAEHVMHIYDTAGENILALGSDFDGIEGNLEIPSPDRFYLLFDELKRRGMKESVIDKLSYKNALRVLSSV